MSSDYKIKINEPCVVELKRQADTLGVTVNTLMAQLVEERATITPSLEVAAGVFLSYLEPEHRKLILDVAAETRQSPAAYILAYIQRAHDQGATALPVPEASDPTMHAPLAPANDAIAKAQPCAWCHKPFTPSREGQRYCPDLDEGESCGRQAGLAAVRASRNKRSDSSIPSPHIVEHLVRI